MSQYIYGYARVSARQQELARQLDLLEKLNCNIKCIKNFKNLYRQRITQ